MVVIEHNLDVIKTADYIIDMGTGRRSIWRWNGHREHRKRWRRYRSPTPDSMSRNIWENSGNRRKALDANVENTQHTVPF